MPFRVDEEVDAILQDLLRLQEYDLKIEAYRERESEIPKQKHKYDVQRERFRAELAERDERIKALQIEQRGLEGEIEQLQILINKYQAQLNSIKKNEEYQALLHEIEAQSKQVTQKEERIIQLMMTLDECRERRIEAEKRVKEELKEIDERCAEIDTELGEAASERAKLEKEREPLTHKVESELLSKYSRIRKSKKAGPAVVPLRNDSCSGCNMAVRPQVVNEVMSGDKVRACSYCGRLLYHDARTG